MALCYLTKFECARVLGLRYLHLVEDNVLTHTTDLRAYVVEELLQGNNPLVIRRTMPDASYEDHMVSDLTLPDALRQLLEFNLQNQR